MPIERRPGQPVGQPQRHSMIVGKQGFEWRKELSEGGQKLYNLLIGEQGDTDLLPTYAAEEGFDLGSALDELRGRSLLDESDPEIVKLTRKRLK